MEAITATMNIPVRTIAISCGQNAPLEGLSSEQLKMMQGARKRDQVIGGLLSDSLCVYVDIRI
jgi:hypothetical protein